MPACRSRIAPAEDAATAHGDRPRRSKQESPSAAETVSNRHNAFFKLPIRSCSVARDVGRPVAGDRLTSAPHPSNRFAIRGDFRLSLKGRGVSCPTQSTAAMGAADPNEGPDKEPMMKKAILSLALTGCMFAGLFGGCNGVGG